VAFYFTKTGIGKINGKATKVKLKLYHGSGRPIRARPQLRGALEHLSPQPSLRFAPAGRLPRGRWPTPLHTSYSPRGQAVKENGAFSTPPPCSDRFISSRSLGRAHDRPGRKAGVKQKRRFTPDEVTAGRGKKPGLQISPPETRLFTRRRPYYLSFS